MQVETIKVDRAKARELYRAYKAHQHYSAPMDQEIQRAYQLIAQGRMVIRAVESIKVAGLFTDGPNVGLPKLAICRATAKVCELDIWTSGAARFCDAEASWRNSRARISMPDGTFARVERQFGRQSAKATLPIIPIHLRPKRGLANYHVLWEAEWQRIPPRDPMLLRRIGSGDMWLVTAAWDLTEVERAALATRLSA